jgi:serine/threonine-protein kinase
MVAALDSESFPERLGRYEVLLPIASGGMGRVFLACSTAMGGFEREVAVKITHEHLGDNLQFFTALIDEARLAGRIRHPNVVSVLDVGDTPDGVFIVMDYVEGDSVAGLRDRLAALGRRFPPEIALRILDDVLAGLHAAHELTDAEGRPLEVVHRDATPSNVLVGLDGVARISDFGVAKAASRLTRTVTGMVKGKIAYMAPEQARSGPIDRTADVWATGVMAWELLSGMRLHEGLNDFALMLKVTREPPPRLRHLRPDLPLALDEAVARALKMNPRDRYPTAEAFAEALAHAAAEAGIAPVGARAVKAFVTPLLLPDIEARRERAARVRRVRFGTSVGPSEPSAPLRSRPVSERPSAPPAPPEPATPTEVILPRTAVLEETELVGAAPVPRRAPRSRTVLLAASVTFAVILASMVFSRVRSTRPTPAPEVATSAAPAEKPAEPTPIVTPSELPVEAEADPDAATISVKELELERGTSPHRPAPVLGPPRAAPLSPTNLQPEPRANPYKKR